MRDDDDEHPAVALLEAVLAPRPHYADAIEAHRGERLRAMHVDAVVGLASNLSRLERDVRWMNWEHVRLSVYHRLAPQLLRRT